MWRSKTTLTALQKNWRDNNQPRPGHIRGGFSSAIRAARSRPVRAVFSMPFTGLQRTSEWFQALPLFIPQRTPIFTPKRIYASLHGFTEQARKRPRTGLFALHLLTPIYSGLQGGGNNNDNSNPTLSARTKGLQKCGSFSIYGYLRRFLAGKKFLSAVSKYRSRKTFSGENANKKASQGGLFYSVKDAAKAWIIPAASATAEVESQPSREKRQPALEKSRLPEYNMTEQQSGRRGGRRLER